jgi:hypothetical protein
LVRTAEAQDAEAVRLLSEAIARFRKTRSAVEAYETALQAYIQDTDLSYNPPRRVNPLDEFTAPKAETAPPAVAPSPPKATKQGIVLETLARNNGKGLKLREVLAALPKDAAIELNIGDLYRALPRLVSVGKAWRDERGRYYYGSSPTNLDDISSSSAERERSLLTEAAERG